MVYLQTFGPHCKDHRAAWLDYWLCICAILSPSIIIPFEITWRELTTWLRIVMLLVWHRRNQSPPVSCYKAKSVDRLTRHVTLSRKQSLCTVVGEAIKKNCSLKWSPQWYGYGSLHPMCIWSYTRGCVCVCLCVSTANVQLHTKYNQKEMIPKGWLACLMWCGGLLAMILVGATHCSTT